MFSHKFRDSFVFLKDIRGGSALIDLVNFVVGCVACFVVGLAAHSILLHEKERHGWHFPWDHDEEDDEG